MHRYELPILGLVVLLGACAVETSLPPVEVRRRPTAKSPAHTAATTTITTTWLKTCPGVNCTGSRLCSPPVLLAVGLLVIGSLL